MENMIEQAIKSREIMDTLVDMVAKGKLSVEKSNLMNGLHAYSTTVVNNLASKEKVWVYKNGVGFFSEYTTSFDGTHLDVPNMLSRRLYKTMEQVHKKKQRENMIEKMGRLEQILGN